MEEVEHTGEEWRQSRLGGWGLVKGGVEGGVGEVVRKSIQCWNHQGRPWKRLRRDRKVDGGRGDVVESWLLLASVNRFTLTFFEIDK